MMTNVSNISTEELQSLLAAKAKKEQTPIVREICEAIKNELNKRLTKIQ